MRRSLPGVLICAVLTAVWLAGVAVGTRAVLARVLNGVPDAAGDPVRGRLEFVLAGVLVVGPLIIAAAARGFRLPRMPQVYVILAGVTVLPAILLAVVGTRQLQTPEPEPTRQHCVTFSGGTNTCPGG
jgi:hypothetical protein